MQGFKLHDPYPVTAADIYRQLQGKTKKERLQWYDEHREETKKALAYEHRKAQFLDGGGY